MIEPSPDAWTLASGTALAVLLFAAIGTWPVCLLILALYRRTIARGMRRSRQLMPPPIVRPPMPNAPAREISLVDGGSAPPSQLSDQALHEIRRVQWAYGTAAVGYGLTAVVVLHQVESMEWLPIRALVLGLIFSWPIVPTLISLTPIGRAGPWLIWSGWLAVVVALLVVGRLPIGQILGGIGLLVVLPALFVLASGARSMRGAAWLVAPSMVLVGLALWELYPVVGALVLDGVWLGTLAVPFLAKALAYLAVIPAYAWVLTKIYQAKLIGDETLLLWQWWLVATIAFASLLAPLGGFVVAAAFLPYAVFLVILLGSFGLRRPRKTPPVRLLLLRTFGARRRSTQLLRSLTRQWRWVGSVELITAPDLATEALTPDELVDFISFRLSRRFVRDESMIDRRLVSLDLRPDRDGRYRVNELMCHDDTWRPVVESLISSVDVILLDLRGFGPQNAGVIDELERLVALVPLHKVVALVDDTTDVNAFRSALWHASAFAPPSSPLATDPFPSLRMVGSPASRAGLRQLVNALGSAAVGTNPGK